MKRFWGFGSIIWIWVICSQALLGQTSAEPNKLIIKIKPEWRSQCQINSIQIKELQLIFNELSVTKIAKVFPFHQPPAALKSSFGDPLVDISLIYELTYTANRSLYEGIQLFEKQHCIAYCEPKYIYEVMYSPNDPTFGSQSNLSVIQAQLGWDISKGDTNTVIAVVDAAIQWDHPDLIDNIKYNWNDPIDGVDNDGDGYIDNFRGWDMGENDNNTAISSLPNPILPHGTWVSGIVSATTDNGIGISGVGFKCKLLPIKACSDYSPGISQGYTGIVYAADHGASVINCSWGGTVQSQLGQDAVNYATFNKNALVIAAAGNANNEAKYFPASYDNVISVTATDDNDIKCGVSSFNSKVDVCAPGSARTTDYLNGYKFDGCYTSYSSPVAAGVAAIIRSYYPNYSAVQAGEHLRVTSVKIDTLNPSYSRKLGFGRVDMQRALFVTSPAIRLQTYSISDQINTIPEPGDTMNLTGVFRNYLSPTSNLKVTITSLDPSIVSIISGVTTLGGIGTNQIKSNLIPFKIAISPSAPQNYVATILLSYNDGPYTDQELLEITINPTYVNLYGGSVATTINSRGNIGYHDYRNKNTGLGFAFMGSSSLLYEGGLVIGYPKSNKLLNNIRNSNGSDADFQEITRATALKPGLSDMDGIAHFNDANADSNKLNIQIDQRALTFLRASEDSLVMIHYVIKNQNFYPIDSLYFGIFADWDIGENSAQNRAEVDSINRVGFCSTTDTTSTAYCGIALLEQNIGFNCYGAAASTFRFDRRSDKLAAITQGTASGNAFTNYPGADIVQFVSAGPLFILPGDSQIVTFAIIGANSQNSLIQNISRARALKRCLFEQQRLNINLPNEVFGCGKVTLNVTTPAAISYLWSNNQTTPIITTGSSGVYIVNVQDSFGCTTSAQTVVTIVPNVTAHIQVSQTNATTLDTIYFKDASTNSTTWNWNFGDGYGTNGKEVKHTYQQPGTYTARLIAKNEACSDTTYVTIKIGMVGLENASLQEFKIYPNPAKNKLWIEIPDLTPELTASLKYLSGSTIQTWHLKPNHISTVIDLPELPAGLYVLEISTQQGLIRQKIAIE